MGVVVVVVVAGRGREGELILGEGGREGREMEV